VTFFFLYFLLVEAAMLVGMYFWCLKVK
jgi:hypothetical protein